MPNISQALVSLVQRSYSSSLQSKLHHIVRASSELFAQKLPREEVEGTNKDVTAILQAELWAMLQRKLGDSSANKKLLFTNGRKTNDEDAPLDLSDFSELAMSEASEESYEDLIEAEVEDYFDDPFDDWTDTQLLYENQNEMEDEIGNMLLDELPRVLQDDDEAILLDKPKEQEFMLLW